MLDTETKRKIDNCRDILVGKIPDPKSQVEQITIALIYKFMDDMDQWSIEQGGKASFFTGEFEKYSWSSIFNPRIGGFEILNLYGEALVKMNQNPNIPQLFRDIFKNAYLPYRDPETLRLFLKEISSFNYDHSEKLGDAFEYLLSVMSSQGDAGQFRTPRHIIDFIVEVIEPQINETVLDPACGTAGFLISAYKHILKKNTKLSTSQKERLMNNFVGYDISADMVRLSLVNMYLHGFPQPHIFEYDTLTSEERWKDTFDCIMANPPFMTPKGGIRPHSRFSIQAKRSEVLFVDYIAEHLNAGGRAGVIVPEGIIFQSQNAYKALRKMLIENYLWAVVSLPAGIFNPYSGVKTSILLMDKSLSKRIDKILFVKIENEGFDLGAQRRQIDGSELPAACKFLNIYKTKIESYKTEIDDTSFAHAVQKSEIAESGDYNLSGDRYRSFEHNLTSQWPMVELSDACCQDRNQILPDSDKAKRLPYIGLENIESDTGIILRNITDPSINIKSLTFAFDDRHVLYGKLRPYLNKVALPDFAGRCSTEIIPLLPNNINRSFLAFILRHQDTTNFVMQNKTGTRMPRADIDLLLTLKIPLPPLEVQEKIVSEINGYQKIIDGARQIVQSYKPSIKINPAWPIVELGTLCELEYGYTDTAKEFGDTRFIRITDIDENGNLKTTDQKFINLSEESKPYLLKKSDILVARTGATFGKTMLFSEPYQSVFASYLIRLNFSPDKINPNYYWVFSQSDNYWQQAESLMTGGGQQQFNANAIKKIKIPLPNLENQTQIVEQIKSEQKIVNENKKLIEIFEKKISDTIFALWK